MAKISFRCPKCNRRGEFDRLPEDPPGAMEAVLICPDCDDGDFHEPRYFSASGRSVEPVDPLRTTEQHSPVEED